MNISPLDPRLETSPADPLLTVRKEFCCFCADFLGEKFHVCQDCGAYVCEQSKRHGRGCIYFGTVLAKNVFRCLVCETWHWRQQGDPPKGGIPVSTHISYAHFFLSFAFRFSFSEHRAGIELNAATVRFHRLWWQEAGQAHVAAHSCQHGPTLDIQHDRWGFGENGAEAPICCISAQCMSNRPSFDQPGLQR